MAAGDILTINWSNTASTTSNSNYHEHAAEYSFDIINQTASQIPPYSYVQSCTLTASMNRTKPTSGTAIGQFTLGIGQGTENVFIIYMKINIDWDKTGPETYTISALGDTAPDSNDQWFTLADRTGPNPGRFSYEDKTSMTLGA
jgi:hypothetical protein